jgi:hypothetical protein
MLPSPLSLCHPPPDSSVLCPPPPSSCLVIHCHIASRCLPPDCLTLSSTRSSRINHHPLLSCCPPPACLASFMSPTHHVIQRPLAPHTIYHDLIVASSSLCPQCLPATSSSSITAAIEHHRHHQTPQPTDLLNKPFMCIAGGQLLLVLEIGDKEGTCDIGRSVDSVHGRPVLAAATGNRM